MRDSWDCSSRSEGSSSSSMASEGYLKVLRRREVAMLALGLRGGEVMYLCVDWGRGEARRTAAKCCRVCGCSEAEWREV